MKKNASSEELNLLLKNSGFKVTPSRLAILTIFSTEKSPLSAEEVQSKLKESTIDTTTVYRTLSSFLKAGIIKQVDLRKQSILYELNNHHHHHITCTNCGKIEDFEFCTIPSLVEKVKSCTSFSTINTHSLEFFGACNDCSK